VRRRATDPRRGRQQTLAIPALHVFAVDTVFKGTAHEQQGVVSPMSGATCGLELAGEGPFALGLILGTGRLVHRRRRSAAGGARQRVRLGAPG
jgi:hypothetical protein